MVTTLRILDETASGVKTEALVLELDTPTLSVRELIERRVRAEVAAHNAAPKKALPRLVQPSPREHALNRQGRARPVDADRQVEIALEAFQRNGFFVLLPDRQAESLDEVFPLEDGLEVSFLRLVPLVGG